MNLGKILKIDGKRKMPKAFFEIQKIKWIEEKKKGKGEINWERE